MAQYAYLNVHMHSFLTKTTRAHYNYDIMASKRTTKDLPAYTQAPSNHTIRRDKPNTCIHTIILPNQPPH